MKSVTIDQGLEYRLEVAKEDLFQGDDIEAILTVKNHGEIPAACGNFTITLALGNLKKVKSKETDAFEIVGKSSEFSCQELAPKGESQQRYNFTFDRNFSVSDKMQSPYLLYGVQPKWWQLLLTVAPHPYIESIFQTLDTVFQFVPKGIVWKNGWTTMKYRAPDTKRFSLVEELNLGCQFEGEQLKLKYSFSTKKFTTGSATLGVTKGKKEIQQSLDPRQYLYGEKFVNQEFLESAINEALAVVASEI